MTPVAHVETGSAGPDEAGPAAVTDQGGLLAYPPVAPSPASQAAGRAGGRGPGVPGLTPAETAAVIAMAARAPSLHNTQPWQFRATGEVIELRADLERMLRQLDPDGRELMISCGAALFGLRLGLRSLGLLPVTDLLPDPAQPWLAGRVRPAGRAAMNKAEADLVAAVPHRHTHRGEFAPGEVAAPLLAALVADAAAEGAELVLVDQTAVAEELVRLADAAAAEQRANPETAAELRRWVREPGSRARDGVPAWAIARLPDEAEPGPAGGHGPRPDSPPRLRLPQRDFGQQHSGQAGSGQAGSGQAGSGQAGSVAPSATAVLSTAGDNPADWLRAGQALHRLLLRAATRWVFASLHSQPLEPPQFRQAVRDLLGLTGHPQMLLEFGRSETAPATPRRPQAELRTDQ